MIAILAFNAAILYLMISGTLYKTTDLVQTIMNRLKETLPGFIPPGSKERKYWAAKMKSVRPIGIQEGEFRTLSSETTTEFVDFFVNQVIALVLTFSY